MTSALPVDNALEFYVPQYRGAVLYSLYVNIITSIWKTLQKLAYCFEVVV